MLGRDYLAFSKEVLRLTGFDLRRCLPLGVEFCGEYDAMYLIECPNGSWFIAGIRDTRDKSVGVCINKYGNYRVSTDLIDVALDGGTWLSATIRYEDTVAVLVANKNRFAGAYLYTNRRSISLSYKANGVFRLNLLRRFYQVLTKKRSIF